jgi:hypothetical protein
MKRIFITLFFTHLFFLSFFTPEKLSAQEEGKRYFTHVFKLVFPDGTIAKLADSDLDDFKIVDSKNKKNYFFKNNVINGNLSVDIAVPDYSESFIMYFKGLEIIRFNVVNEGNKVKYNIPSKITLPFNYVITASPNSVIEIFSKQGQPINSYNTDKNGNIFLSVKKNYFADKFIVCKRPDKFPTVKTYTKPEPAFKNYLYSRKLTFKHIDKTAIEEFETSNINNFPSVIHNVIYNIYYKLQLVNFSVDGEQYPWLLSYNGNTGISAVRKLNIKQNKGNLSGIIYLNQDGNIVVVLENENPETFDVTRKSYLVTLDGNIKILKNNLYPIYEFKGNYYLKENWIIPVFKNIILKNGQHIFKVVCNNGLSDSEEFEIIKTGNPKSLWAFRKPNSSFTDSLYLPTGFSNKKINNDIDTCFISVDGNNVLKYTCFNKKIADKISGNKNEIDLLKLSKKDNNPWKMQFTLFQKNKVRIVHGHPMNMWEGPYPKLQYKIHNRTLKYSTVEEARQHCKIPIISPTGYFCYNEMIIDICPEKYGFSIIDGKVITDSSLYCKSNQTISMSKHSQEQKEKVISEEPDKNMLEKQFNTVTNSTNDYNQTTNLVLASSYEFNDSGYLYNTAPVINTIPLSAKIDLTDAYLPVNGFTSLEIQLDTIPLDTTNRRMHIVIHLKNESNLPFVKVTKSDGLSNLSGNFTTDILISEPSPADYHTLKDLPMYAEFNIKILRPSDDSLFFEKDTLLPLGYALIYGKTIDINYMPRQEPFAPEFYQTIYEITNEADINGNFFILFNTTLFDYNCKKLQKLAKHTGNTFDKNNFNFYLKWPEGCSMPLTYILPENIESQLTAGKKVPVGIEGAIDLLSPGEQEERLKKTLISFINSMPLKKEKKLSLIKELKSLSFIYNNPDLKFPVYSKNFKNGNAVLIPASKAEYWGTITQGNKDMTLLNIIHVLGHFIEDQLSANKKRSFAFLENRCEGPEYLWKPYEENKNNFLFNPNEYISFEESTADFFSYLLFNFIKNDDDNFYHKSSYYKRSFLDELTDKSKIKKTLESYPGYIVSGLQSAFLISFYEDLCKLQPANVFSDFMLNTNLYASYLVNGEPARTINEWISAKHTSYLEKYILRTPDPSLIASKYNIIYETPFLFLIPEKNYSSNKIIINNKAINDFNQIPAIKINNNSTITINNGFYKVQALDFGPQYFFKVHDGSKFEYDKNGTINLLAGWGYFYAPIPFHLLLDDIMPTSWDFKVSNFEKEVYLEVYNGELSIQEEKEGVIEEEVIVKKNEFTILNKTGKAKKPKPIKSNKSIKEKDNTDLFFSLNHN